MLNAQELLKKNIEEIEDANTIERISIFVAGILAQQGIEKRKNVSNSGGSTPPPVLPPAD